MIIIIILITSTGCEWLESSCAGCASKGVPEVKMCVGCSHEMSLQQKARGQSHNRCSLCILWHRHVLSILDPSKPPKMSQCADLRHFPSVSRWHLMRWPLCSACHTRPRRKIENQPATCAQMACRHKIQFVHCATIRRPIVQRVCW